MASPAGRTERRTRPSYLAAPPLLSESEPFEGAALLRENPGPLGVLLWKSLRDVSLWTATAAEDRGALFGAGAGQARRDEIAQAGGPAALWGPLLVIAQVLDRPGEVDVRRLAGACRSVAAWAELEGAGAAQLAFAQAAALLVPESARLAYAVGRLARDRGEYARGESWLRAAVRLARNRDWDTYTLAYLSLGTLYQHVGNMPAAETLTQRGLRTARRRHLRGLEAAAYHNLFVLAAERGEYTRAQDYAGAALARYEENHPRLPYLAYDLGCVWFLCGRFREALPVLQAVLPHIPDSVERPMLLANVARAAAGAGDRSAFHDYWEQAVSAAAEYGEHALVAQAWLNLARGAVSVREPGLAEVAALHAGAIADRLRLGQIRIEAESVLQCARTGGSLPHITESAERTALARESDEMAYRMIRALEQMSA